MKKEEPKFDDVRSYNVGESDYSKHKIQPWDIWIDYKLNPFDADIIKRVLRHKKTDSRKLDYEKIIHICKERIRQIDSNEDAWAEKKSNNVFYVYYKNLVNYEITDVLNLFNNPVFTGTYEQCKMYVGIDPINNQSDEKWKKIEEIKSKKDAKEEHNDKEKICN